MPHIDVKLIEMCVKHLKSGEAAGADRLVAEHIIQAVPSLIMHITLLFCLILSHGYVPDAFSFGIIIPIVKDKSGDPSLLDNYRPITLNPVITKWCENARMELFGDHLISDDLQFGFKKKVGCPSAIFVLRQLVQFFNSRSSNVYIASLDASKAFDRVNHFRLFSTLINKKFPIVFNKVIIN